MNRENINVIYWGQSKSPEFAFSLMCYHVTSQSGKCDLIAFMTLKALSQLCAVPVTILSNINFAASK